MAFHIDAGPDIKRGDLFHIDPTEIIVDEALRGRRFVPSADEITDMACSLLDHGQQQPVKCRRLPNKRLQLCLGFTRCAAARLIRDGFTDADGEARGDPNFRLQVRVVDENDQKAFLANIVENAHRNDTGAMNDAHNHQTLRERYGHTDAEITRHYGYRDPGRVGRLRQLLLLDDADQVLVHTGRMSVAAAIDLLALPPGDRDAARAAAMNGDGKVVGARVRDQVREHHLRDADAEERAREEAAPDTATGSESAPNGQQKRGRGRPKGSGGKAASAGASSAATSAAPGAVPLSLKNIKSLLAEIEATEANPGPMRRLAGHLVEWIRGERGVVWLKNRWRESLAGGGDMECGGGFVEGGGK